MVPERAPVLYHCIFQHSLIHLNISFDPHLPPLLSPSLSLSLSLIRQTIHSYQSSWRAASWTRHQSQIQARSWPAHQYARPRWAEYEDGTGVGEEGRRGRRFLLYNFLRIEKLDISKPPMSIGHISTAHIHNFHALGRYFSFCASLPLRTIWFTHRFEWAPAYQGKRGYLDIRNTADTIAQKLNLRVDTYPSSYFQPFSLLFA